MRPRGSFVKRDMMRPLIALTCSFAAALATAQSGAPAPRLLKDDPSLKGTVTLRLKDEPIDSVMKQISSQTHTMVEAANSISDLKLTIFVDKLPEGTLLDKIASVLGATWSLDSGIHILNVPIDEATRRQKFMDLEDQLLRSGAEADAKKLSDAAGNASGYDDFAETYGKEEQLSPTGQLGPRHFRGQHAGPQMVLSTPAAYAVGKLFSGWSQSDWDAFWSGQVAYTFINPQIDQPGDTEDVQRGFQVRRVSPERAVIFARYDAFGEHTLEFAQPPQGRYPHGPRAPGDDEMAPELAKTDFGKEVLAWPNFTGNEQDEALTRRFPNPQASAIPGTQDYYGRTTMRLADQLDSLSALSGLPVVADGFRTAEPEGVAGKTALSWLGSLKKTDNCYLRIEDGVVMVRHGHFWRDRLSEIPEDAIRTMDEKGKNLTVMDYANFLTGLTPAQLAPLTGFTPPILGFPVDVVQNSIPALQFLGAVGSSISPGVPVRYSNLSGTAQQLFTSAIFNGLFSGGSWNGPGPGLDPEQCAVLVKEGDVNQNGKVVPGVTVLFGTSQVAAIVYSIPIPAQITD